MRIFDRWIHSLNSDELRRLLTARPEVTSTPIDSHKALIRRLCSLNNIPLHGQSTLSRAALALIDHLHTLLAQNPHRITIPDLLPTLPSPLAALDDRTLIITLAELSTHGLIGGFPFRPEATATLTDFDSTTITLAPVDNHSYGLHHPITFGDTSTFTEKDAFDALPHTLRDVLTSEDPVVHVVFDWELPNLPLPGITRYSGPYSASFLATGLPLWAAATGLPAPAPTLALPDGIAPETALTLPTDRHGDLPSARTEAARRADLTRQATGPVLTLIGALRILLRATTSQPIPFIRSGGIGKRERTRLYKLMKAEAHLDNPDQVDFLIWLAYSATLLTYHYDSATDTDGLRTSPWATAFLATTPARQWAILLLAWATASINHSDYTTGLLSDSSYDEAPASSRTDRIAAWLDALLLAPADGPTTGWDVFAQRYPSYAYMYNPSSILNSSDWLGVTVGGHGTGIAAWMACLPDTATDTIAPRRVLSILRRCPTPDLIDTYNSSRHPILDTPHPPVEGFSAEAYDPLYPPLGPAEATIIELAAHLEAALPDTTSELIAQGDMTLMAPTLLDAATENMLADIATLDSPGLATVWRITPDTLSAGLERGHTPDAIRQFLTSRIRGPLPNPLDYALADLKKTAGSITIRPAASIITAPVELIPQLLTHRALADYTPWEIAPGIVATTAEPTQLARALKTLNPTLLDADGSLIRHHSAQMMGKASDIGSSGRLLDDALTLNGAAIDALPPQEVLNVPLPRTALTTDTLELPQPDPEDPLTAIGYQLTLDSSYAEQVTATANHRAALLAMTSVDSLRGFRRKDRDARIRYIVDQLGQTHSQDKVDEATAERRAHAKRLSDQLHHAHRNSIRLTITWTDPNTDTLTLATGQVSSFTGDSIIFLIHEDGSRTARLIPLNTIIDISTDIE